MTTLTRDEEIDQLLQGYAAQGEPGLAAALVDRGEVVFAHAYGQASLEHDIPTTLETRFPIASITKTFVAAITVLLDRRDRLSLDDPVRRHAPELPETLDAPPHVTLRRLLSMTSGLRDSMEMLRLAGYWWRGTSTADDMIQLLARQPHMNFRPGSEFLYTNVNFTLVARILERVTGSRFPDLLRATVLTPLGMTSTVDRDDPSTVVRDLACGYIPDAGDDWRRGEWSFGLGGAGSLVSTVPDLIRWLGVLRTGRLDGHHVLTEMRTPVELEDGSISGYGLGLQLLSYRGLSIIAHGGSLPGCRSLLAYAPDRDLGLVVLSNRDNLDREGLLANVIDLWCGPQLAVSPPVRAGKDSVAAGRYVDPVLGESVEVKATDDGLEIDLMGAVAKLAVGDDGSLVDILSLAPVRLTPELRTDDTTVLHLACGGRIGRFHPAERPSGKDIARLAAYLGRYRNAELETVLEVSLADGHLRMRYGPPGHSAAQFLLTALADDVFQLHFDRPGYAFAHCLRFRRGADRRVHEVLISGARLKDVRFERENG